MRNKSAGLLGLALVAGLGTTLGVSSVSAAPTPSAKNATRVEPAPVSDDLVSPREEKRRALRQQAVTEVLNGTARPQKRGASTVVKISSTKAPEAVNRRGVVQQKAATTDQYVELGREKTDRIFVVLAEFGNDRDPRFPDKDIEPSTPGPVTWDGPLHNKIPEPDRAVDNTTVWQPDYSPAHFRELYFGEGGRSRLGRGDRVPQAVLRAPVVGPLQRRRHGHRLGQGEVQRGTLRPLQRRPGH